MTTTDDTRADLAIRLAAAHWGLNADDVRAAWEDIPVTALDWLRTADAAQAHADAQTAALKAEVERLKAALQDAKPKGGEVW